MFQLVCSNAASKIDVDRRPVDAYIYNGQCIEPTNLTDLQANLKQSKQIHREKRKNYLMEHDRNNFSILSKRPEQVQEIKWSQAKIKSNGCAAALENTRKHISNNSIYSSLY
jgi:hypothetical protein